MTSPKPDYDYARVLGLAGSRDRHGTRVATITVAKGKTAFDPTRPDAAIHGPVVIRYEIHPAGVRATILDGHDR